MFKITQPLRGFVTFYLQKFRLNALDCQQQRQRQAFLSE